MQKTEAKLLVKSLSSAVPSSNDLVSSKLIRSLNLIYNGQSLFGIFLRFSSCFHSKSLQVDLSSKAGSISG